MIKTLIPFKGENNQYHFIYRTHNLINGKEYTGKHSTTNLDDGYYGSGDILRLAVNKYGIENFKVEILSFHKTSSAAYLEEFNIVDEKYKNKENTYNQKVGGAGGWNATGKVTVKDKDGNTMRVSVDDPRYLSGVLVHHTRERIAAKYNNGNTFQISKNDPMWINGEVSGCTKGQTTYKDNNGNIIHTNNNDPRVLSGNLVGIMKNRSFKMRTQSQATCPHCGKSGRATNIKKISF